MIHKKQGETGSAHLTATTSVQSVAAGRENSQIFRVPVAGCEWMSASFFVHCCLYQFRQKQMQTVLSDLNKHFPCILRHLSDYIHFIVELPEQH